MYMSTGGHRNPKPHLARIQSKAPSPLRCLMYRRAKHKGRVEVAVRTDIVYLNKDHVRVIIRDAESQRFRLATEQFASNSFDEEWVRNNLSRTPSCIARANPTWSIPSRPQSSRTRSSI